MNQQSHGHIVFVTLQALGEWQGAATHVNEVVNGLRRAGWRVSFFGPDHTAVRVGLIRRLGTLLAVQARAITAIPGADLVYVRHHALSGPVALCATMFGVPRIEEVNGTLDDLIKAHPWTRMLAGMLRWSSRLILSSATAISAVSNELATELAGSTPVYVIPNGVDVDRFRPSPAVQEDRPAHVLFVGALTPWQGLDVIQTARRHPDWPDHVGLVVVGDGPLHNEIADDNYVDYRGSVPHEKVAELIGAALATLSIKHRSARGASPLKLYESLGCAVPVIVTDVPPQSTLVRSHGCGIVIPPDDPGALARAVADLAGNPDRRDEMGALGRAAVVAEHSWQARINELSDVLKPLVAAGRP